MAVRNVGEDLHHVRRDRSAGLGQRLGEALRFQDGAQEGVGGKVAVAEGVADGNAEQDVLADRGVLVVAVGVERIDRIGEAGRVQRHANRPPRLDERPGEVGPPGGLDRSAEPAAPDQAVETGGRDRLGKAPRGLGRARVGAAVEEVLPQGGGEQDRLAAGIGDAPRPRLRGGEAEIDAPEGEAAARRLEPAAEKPGEDAGAPVAVVRQGEMGGKGDGQVDRREAGAARPVKGRDPLRREPAGARQVHRAPAASGAPAGLGGRRRDPRRAAARRRGRSASGRGCHGGVAAERGRDGGGDGSGGDARRRARAKRRPRARRRVRRASAASASDPADAARRSAARTGPERRRSASSRRLRSCAAVPWARSAGSRRTRSPKVRRSAPASPRARLGRPVPGPGAEGSATAAKTIPRRTAAAKRPSRVERVEQGKDHRRERRHGA